jgi:Rrf2 family protein
MYISARVDYAMRALLELAAAQRENPRAMLKGDAIAETHNIPTKFLVGVLTTLRTAGILASMRGRDGGFRLARPATDISVADVMRALEGPLAEAVKRINIGTRVDKKLRCWHMCLHACQVQRAPA